ncbi:MAG: hypothetical protein JOZ72_19985 [Alphaproteobacteria bacterium]|nr:hypothetical protein [Alphaproteobacteria bacterium]
MQFAKDKRSGVELPAKKAVAGRIYACPICGEDVHVKGGFIYVRHFAHRSGRADRACENYHGGSSIAHPLAIPAGGQGVSGGGQDTRIDPLKLGIRVEAGANVARGDLRRWRLVLTLPKAPTGIGRLRVPTGFGNQSREVRLFALAHAPQDIDVSPNAPRFGPEWVSDEVNLCYREIVSDRLEGLSPSAGYAFATSTAAVKAQANSFDWGDSFYIIWKLPDVVIPDALNALHLSAHEGWSAALITLPPDAVEDIAIWLHDLFSLRVQDAKRRWGILFPPPIDIDLDNNISVSDATHVLMGFAEAADVGEAGSKLSMATVVSQQECSTRAGRDIHLLVARDGSDSRGALHLRWGSKNLPAIKSVLIAGPLTSLPKVTLRVRDAQSDRDRTVSLDRPEARQALDAVRRGQADLIALSAPHRLGGVLQRRKGGGDWTMLLALQPTAERAGGDAWAVPPKHITTIAEILSDLESDVRLSFGTLGHYVAFAHNLRPVASVRLSPDTRRRLLWYVQANRRQRAGAAHPIHSSSDEDLIDAFGRIAPPLHLTAYRNLLRQRLQTEGIMRSAS